MGLIAVFSGLIPIVGPIIAMVFMFIISIGVAKAFEKGIVFGFGLFLLPLIFYPILAFSGLPHD
jgi:predicted PurR-regulated permease PerM